MITLLTFLFSGHAYATNEKNIPVEGEWGDERVRSSVPTRLMVSIDGNLLSFKFEMKEEMHFLL
jgi:hypothetical protein